MFRTSPTMMRPLSCFPHACGDVPCNESRVRYRDVFSPRMWGCSSQHHGSQPQQGVFPTHVGMFLVWIFPRSKSVRFPHACGDVPLARRVPTVMDVFSPRMWGCSEPILTISRALTVFPTHVGMFRWNGLWDNEPPGFPHACGDVPESRVFDSADFWFSPRMWGCSVPALQARPGEGVSPTHVGMFRAGGARARFVCGFPHACGDVPMADSVKSAQDMFSPRMWGCSWSFQILLYARNVFPTHVGMFHEFSVAGAASGGFPHACGDVPCHRHSAFVTLTFSPRMWGCSGAAIC